MSRYDDALSVRCPDCHVRPGTGCVYVPVKVPPKYRYSEKVRVRIALTGTPTKVPHLARLREFDRKSRARIARALAAERDRTQDRAARDAAERWRALRQYDQAESDALRDFLRAHAHRLFGFDRESRNPR